LLFTNDEFEDYIAETFPEVSTAFISQKRIVDYCPHCNTSLALEIYSMAFVEVKDRLGNSRRVLHLPYFVMFHCPECKAERRWLLYDISGRKYRLLSIPGEGDWDIPELPIDPPSLRKAYAEAMRCLNSNAPMAAAAMLRRAVQVITRDILGAPPSQLGNELKWLSGRENKLGVVLSQDFHDNAYILKETGNQAAHPDADPDLLEFTEEDSRHLHNIFLEMIAELFVVPDAKRKARDGILKRRKIRGLKQSDDMKENSQSVPVQNASVSDSTEPK
jgi:Domain of unknown function (DUF4145)